MDKDELETHLGTIANSGSFEFKMKMNMMILILSGTIWCWFL